MTNYNFSVISVTIIIIIFVYYSCSHNATTEPTSVTQDSTDTIEHKASIYNETQHKVLHGYLKLLYTSARFTSMP